MKLIILVVAALVAIAIAAPAAPGAPVAISAPAADQNVVPILRSDFDQQPNGGYNFALETGDGTKKEETGELKTVNDEENKPHDVVVMRGSYSYVDPEGKTHTVTYLADENGFQPESEDIPKAQ